MTIRTIDAHVAGQGVRLAVDGMPAPRGRDMLGKRDWFARHADGLRRGLILEPRGHGDLCGAMLTEPVTPGAHAGLWLFDAGGYPLMSGSAAIAVAAIALERQLIVIAEDAQDLVFDTPAGSIRAAVRREETTSVAVRGVPSFVHQPGLAVNVAGRHILADVAFAGGFFAVVDSEAAGLGMSIDRLPELRRAGVQIVESIERAQTIEHPADARMSGIDGVVFTGPAAEGRADLRTVTVRPDGSVTRSPSGTGVSAVVAVLAAMGVVTDGASIVTESLFGTRIRCRAASVTMVGEREAVIPEIDADAWITGDHAFVFDDGDPLREGLTFEVSGRRAPGTRA